MNVSSICDYIIQNTITEGKETGIQYVTTYDEINERFNVQLTDKKIKDIVEELECRDEVASVFVDELGFDILIYISYAINYDPDDYIVD